MGNPPKGLNEAAWEKLFEKYDILHHVHTSGAFEISAAQIKAFREPRLMAKFDHRINLPEIFARNRLAILPISRGDYAIAHFDAYHPFEAQSGPVQKVSLPAYIQSLNIHQLQSEAIALNCAMATGLLADFLADEALVPTVSGRMGSGTFDFSISSLTGQPPLFLKVANAQIEIDAAYEGRQSLALFEAKRDLADDFLVRQLYYPYRVWQNRVAKQVRPVFLVYSNGIYRLYEYGFQNPTHYNSLALLRQKNYSLEDTSISLTDIQAALASAPQAQEPAIPFPQADRFERVINLCELLAAKPLTRDEITCQYAFDARQTNYYTDAARYLSLIEKARANGMPLYTLTEQGKRILQLGYKQRQLAFCSCILSHKAFRDTLSLFFERGHSPSTGDVVKLMKTAGLYRVESDSTFERRSSTVKGWVHWILRLITQ